VHLLVVTSLYPTADRPEVGSFVADRVNWLRRTGHEVTVVAATTYRSNAVLRHWAMLRQVVGSRSIRVDGVEGHVLFPAGLVAVMAARLHGVPLALYAHGSDVALSAQRTPLHRLLARLAARMADAVITNSEDTSARVARLGVKASVIPPGVDFELFAPGDQEAARTRLGIQTDLRIAMFLGRLEPDKGPDLFAEAVSKAEGWLGVAVGDGSMKAQLRARWPEVRYHEGVHHSLVADRLRAADVVVVPSRAEGLGLVAVEALACGVPVVATPVGGLVEVVIDNVNGRLVDSVDAASITAALDDLSDEAQRARLAVGARASVATHDIRLTTEEMRTMWAALAPTN